MSNDKKSLFRKTALDHYLGQEDVRSPLRVSEPWTWALFWILIAGLLAALLFTFFSKVEVNDVERGVLQTEGGASTLTAQVGGTVTRLLVRVGGQVDAGSPVIELRSHQDFVTLTPSDHRLKKPRVESFDIHRDSLRESTVLAPTNGSLESLLVKPGDAVSAGQPLGSLIPEGTTVHVVSYVPEGERVFIHVGDEARVEMDQLSDAEHGIIKVRVMRVGQELTSPEELPDNLTRSKLGGPLVRIDLESMPGNGPHLPLHPGMTMNVHYALHRQRLLGVIFTPLGRFLRE